MDDQRRDAALSDAEKTSYSWMTANRTPQGPLGEHGPSPADDVWISPPLRPYDAPKNHSQHVTLVAMLDAGVIVDAERPTEKRETLRSFVPWTAVRRLSWKPVEEEEPGNEEEVVEEDSRTFRMQDLAPPTSEAEMRADIEVVCRTAQLFTEEVSRMLGAGYVVHGGLLGYGFVERGGVRYWRIMLRSSNEASCELLMPARPAEALRFNPEAALLLWQGSAQTWQESLVTAAARIA
jgi:hypothetical protein